MKLAKRTYSLPPKTIERFETEVDSGRRSTVIAELIDKYLENKKREALRKDIEEGCREMWDIYRETAREWAPLDAEADRALGEY